jgi:hypothetical protein
VRASRTPPESERDSSEAKPDPTASVSEGLTSLSPYRVLNDALKAVPAVKYALGVAGVIAAIALAAVFRMDYRVAFFGAIVMFVLMVLLVVFARLTRTAPKHFIAPVVVLLWSFLLLSIGTACLLFTSVFFKIPWTCGNGSSLLRRPESLRIPPRAYLRFWAKGYLDDYCIMARAPGSGYLYVFQQDTAGRIQWLFPSNDTTKYSSGTNPVLAQQTLTIPADTGLAL